MRYVYCIAFHDEDFIMVYNPRRGGWEMPGGKVEEGESDQAAAEREFLEEVGHEIEVMTRRQESQDVTVYAGRVGRRVDKGEMKWRRFKELPKRLSFPKVEYLPLIEWAKKEIRS